MHPEYAMYGEPPDRVIEECAELIQAIAKSHRFGWFNHIIRKGVKTEETNLDRVRSEIADVKHVIKQLEEWMAKDIEATVS